MRSYRSTYGVKVRVAVFTTEPRYAINVTDNVDVTGEVAIATFLVGEPLVIVVEAGTVTKVGLPERS